MDNEMKIREQVYNKMESEYNKFIENLKKKTSEEIIQSSYEKVMKEEILSDFYPDYKHYDIEETRALNKIKEPLEELYQGWMDSDVGINHILEDVVSDTLDNLVEEQKQKKNSRER